MKNLSVLFMILVNKDRFLYKIRQTEKQTNKERETDKIVWSDRER